MPIFGDMRSARLGDLPWGRLPESLLINLKAPPGGCPQTSQHFHELCLSVTLHAGNSKHLSSSDFKGDILQHSVIAVIEGNKFFY